MTGDTSDMQARLRRALPLGWFGESTPVLDSLLGGLATAWSWCFGLMDNVRAQLRIATASDFGLDLIATDFFGGAVARNGDDDAAFRSRIKRELLREKGTRAAVGSVLRDLTGRAPTIFEPQHPADTGGYAGATGASGGLAYGRAGGWGTLTAPYQTFVVAYRPLETGIPFAAGWGTAAGGYGVGQLQYADLQAARARVTDADIYAAVASVLPAAVSAWVQISD